MKKIVLFVLGLSVINIGHSQTGPGGVGASDGASNLELWLDANRGTSTTTDGANISQWNDQSGNSINITKGTAGNQPSFENDGTNAINGYPVVRFDGDDRLEFSTTTLNINNELTVFVVKEDNATQPSGSNYYMYLSGSSLGVLVYRNWTADKFKAKGSMDYINAAGVTNDSPYIGEYKRSGTTMYLSRFGGAYITDVGTTGPIDFGTNSTLYIGTNLQSNIAEEIVFSRAVNTAEKIIIENYLAAKYGVSLGVNDIYNEDGAGNGNYDHEVAGIGRVDASNIHTDAQGTSIVRILNPTGLGDDEFLIWGHDNGTQLATETTDVPASVDARLDRVWRVSESNSLGAAVDVGAIDIRFDLSGLGPITASHLSLLVDADNDGVFSDETPISGATALGGDIYQFAGVTAIANNLRFTLGNSETPLPIELVNFSANLLDDGSIKLDWQTASEISNDYFTIERSNNGIDWEQLFDIDGAGNSTSLLNYSSLDSSPYFGISYYRLKQTDFDGMYSYSQVRSVNIKNLENILLDFYPNPTENKLSIVGNESELRQLKIYNAHGQNVTMFTEQIISSHSKLVIDLSNLSTGLYYIKTRNTTNKVYKQ